MDGGGGGAGYFGGQGGTSDAGGGSGGSGFCDEECGQCLYEQGTQGQSVGEGPTAPPQTGHEGYLPGCGEGRRTDGGDGCISITIIGCKGELLLL